MSANVPSIFRDSAGNIRERPGQGKVLFDSTYFKSTLGSAAAASATITGATGYHMIVDFAQVVVASIASSTTVLATLTDGTTSWPVGAFSANGVYTLVGPDLSQVSIRGASGGTMVLQVGTPGTGGSVVSTLACHKVTAADV